jgi:hypothetical protein
VLLLDGAFRQVDVGLPGRLALALRDHVGRLLWRSSVPSRVAR